MPTLVQYGTEVKEIDLYEIFPPNEGEINQYYGKIGSGKTANATRDIIKKLKQGKIIYASWKIDWQGYDERNSKWKLFLGLLGKRQFNNFKPENLHHVDIFDLDNLEVDGKKTGKDFVTWLSTITDCEIWLDEGHVAFDSYDKTKMELAKRNLALLTRHLDRTIVLISQRPIQIHVTFRSQVNRFYKCEKISDTKLFGVRFQKTEFQETDSDGLPNEKKKQVYNEETHMLEDTDEYEYAESQERWRGNKKIFSLYDSKYRRGNLGHSQQNYTQIFHMTWLERWQALWHTSSIKSELTKK